MNFHEAFILTGDYVDSSAKIMELAFEEIQDIEHYYYYLMTIISKNLAINSTFLENFHLIGTPRLT